MKKKLLLLLVLISVLQVEAAPNLRFPTLGGMQFWNDIKIQAGWRVQRNFITGHYRLLNPEKTRYAWGNRIHCLAQLKEHAPEGEKEKKVICLILSSFPKFKK